MTDRELLKQALNALETKGEHHPRVYQAIAALRDRLAQPEHQWVDLTRAEFAEILCDDRLRGKNELMLLQTQAKLKEKNT